MNVKKHISSFLCIFCICLLFSCSKESALVELDKIKNVGDKMANWDFKSMYNIEINGFNSHGDSFKDKPIFHLAKEICQNSTDTIVSHEMDDDKPIKIEFKEFWLKPSMIPGNENGDLTKVFEEEYEFASDRYKEDRTVPDIYSKTLEVRPRM